MNKPSKLVLYNNWDCIHTVVNVIVLTGKPLNDVRYNLSVSASVGSETIDRCAAREPWFTLSNDAVCVYFLNAGIVVLLWSTRCFFLSPSLNKKPVSFHNIADKCYMLITTTTVFINNFIKVYFFMRINILFVYWT